MASMSCAALLGTPNTRRSCAAPSTPSASAPAAHAAISSTTQTSSRPRHRGWGGGVGGASGDLRAFGAHGALHLGFAWEPWPMLHHSLSFSSFPSGHQQVPGDWSPRCCSTAPHLACHGPPASQPSTVPHQPLPALLPWRPPRPRAAGRAAPQRLWRPRCAALQPRRRAPLAPTTSCANNAFTFGLELSCLITPLANKTHSFAAAAAAYYRSQQKGLADPAPPPAQPSMTPAPPSRPFSFQLLLHLSESPVFHAPPSPPDSLSDRDSYLSGSLSSRSLSGSESRSLGPGHRLPIFSRLSISED